MFFLEGKNQRTFAHKMTESPAALSPMSKVFLLLFPQKKKSLAFPPTGNGCSLLAARVSAAMRPAFPAATERGRGGRPPAARPWGGADRSARITLPYGSCRRGW